MNAGGNASAAAKAAAVRTGLTGRLLSHQSIDYEHGLQSLQPAHLFNVLLVGPTGLHTGINFLVPAVLISGQEGDTLYDTCALPPPGSLTIWWQDP